MELLEIQNVSKSYVNHKALQDINLKISEKSIFGLLGPNGAGKTTLIRIITQIINQDNGKVLLKGKEITSRDVRRIGYLPEERGLYKKMKVGDQLLFLAGLKGLNKSQARREIKYWFDKLRIDGWWSKKVEDLSKGMSQKIQFIATVIHKPEVIILDEPFSGFDPVNANLIKENILELNEAGATIIFSTHRMESVEELCDQVAMINNASKILDGSTTEIKNMFRSNTYLIEHNEEIGSLPDGFDVALTNKPASSTLTSEIKIPESKSSNDLLKLLLPQTEVISFNEKIPSMNDIFIMKVREGEGHE